jgi:hypothetical protein
MMILFLIAILPFYTQPLERQVGARESASRQLLGESTRLPQFDLYHPQPVDQAVA